MCWPVANVLFLSYKDRDGKERLVSLSIDKIKLVTYFLHYLLNEAIKRLVTASRCLELSSLLNLACLMLYQCLCNMLNDFMLVPDWHVGTTLKRINRRNLAEFILKTPYLDKSWKRKEAQELICLCHSMGSVLAKRWTLPLDFWPKLIWLLLGILPHFPFRAMSARACRDDTSLSFRKGMLDS